MYLGMQIIEAGMNNLHFKLHFFLQTVQAAADILHFILQIAQAAAEILHFILQTAQAAADILHFISQGMYFVFYRLYLCFQFHV